MKNKMKKQEEELKKDCGKDKCGFNYIGEIGSNKLILCPICEAKLQQLQEDKKVFKKIIENRLIVLRQHSDLENVKVVIRKLEELKKELVGE